MNLLDVFLIAFLIFGGIQGLRHGFVKEIGSFLAIVCGIYFSRFYSEPFSLVVVEWLDCSPKTALIIAYVTLFIIGTLGIHLVAFLMSKLLDLIKLGWINKIIGCLFGAFKWLLILSVILNILSMINTFAPLIEGQVIKSSILYKPIENTIGKVLPFLDFDKFKEFSHNLSSETIV